ncbi:ATP-mannose-1-phosphate guanylyltransferase, putative [Candida dubliniensis CD36]|uniref:mannose-1-phosphate guanylyltransferase n=1 Tax=Candida dubliniensis (strain CD36 / ATCC MYA-646 / CBS 7987 / NCPF 3949 / NRRL Y-17841) TaxID=573826 RepID=B9W9U1_CANDC|nr:ATP-mannose-1-phosphate guanylyltransferase, putative [Candida dubliniensis CD36]CAX45578.1 ATP-mannose-1-phosphate guanylyltransferase, putative [Candida dubliniensis CD36]
MTLKVLILTGGETTGTRFRPLSMECPKLLFPLCGKPLISHIIDNLTDQFATRDLEILLMGFFKDQHKTMFLEYIQSVNKSNPDLKIKYLSEPFPLGTAGGLYHFKDEIFTDSNCKLLMIHGDVICNYPFKEMLEFFEQTKSNITLYGVDPVSLLKRSEAQILVANGTENGDESHDDDIVTKFGAIVAERKNYKVVHYVEKPSSSISEFRQDSTYEILLNGGIYIFDRSILDLLTVAEIKKKNSIQFDDELDDDNTSNKNDNVLSLELDVFKTLPQLDNTNFNVYKSTGFWYQLKSPLSALLANNFFLAQSEGTKLASGPELVQPVQILTENITQAKSCKIGPNVSIGKNVTIGNGVRMVNCIVCDDVTIGDNTIIKNAIIANGTKIGKWCRIEGTVTASILASNVISSASAAYMKSLNDIVILCQNTVVQNQVFVYNSVVLPHKELKKDVKYEIIM